VNNGQQQTEEEMEMFDRFGCRLFMTAADHHQHQLATAAAAAAAAVDGSAVDRPAALN
jgi:hypothetical protein